MIQTASVAKYRILLKNSIVVGQANTLESVLADWELLNENILQAAKLETDTEAILQMIETLQRFQNRANIRPVTTVPVLKDTDKENRPEQLPRAVSLKSSSQLNSPISPRIAASTHSMDAESLTADVRVGLKQSPGSVPASEPTTPMASRPVSVAAASSTNEAHEATTEVLYENQRSGLVGDFTEKLLMPPIDPCGAWCDVAEQPKTKDELSLPVGWVWTSEWRIDKSENCDANGWRYALYWNSEWLSQPRYNTFVRRRKWVRTRTRFLKTADPSPETAASAESKASLGGDNAAPRQSVEMTFVRHQRGRFLDWLYRAPWLEVAVYALILVLVVFSMMNYLEMSRMSRLMSRLEL